MRIGELAGELGTTAQAVRFYERAGLLREPERTKSGYRVYGATDVERLRFIRKAKELGFSLSEIGGILHMHDAGQVPCARVMEIAERHLRETRAEIRRLSRFRAELASALRRWRRTPTRTITGDAICALIERTVDDNHWKNRAVRSSGQRKGRV
ncbi:MAG: heavy metal-responsive transcriptional regulator [Acidobacteriia bacterium]|nr:heavy metal-responsive transcriptional regulator [Terriglobia bacterium]